MDDAEPRPLRRNLSVHMADAKPNPPIDDAAPRPTVADATPRPPVGDATPLPSNMLSGECAKDGPAKEACMHCRRSKVRCASEKEGKKCVRCARLGYDCQGAGPSKRGLPGVFGSERFKTSREHTPTAPLLVLARAHLLVGAAYAMRWPACAGAPIVIQRYATAISFGRSAPPSRLRLGSETQSCGPTATLAVGFGSYSQSGNTAPSLMAHPQQHLQAPFSEYAQLQRPSWCAVRPRSPRTHELAGHIYLHQQPHAMGHCHPGQGHCQPPQGSWAPHLVSTPSALHSVVGKLFAAARTEATFVPPACTPSAATSHMMGARSLPGPVSVLVMKTTTGHSHIEFFAPNRQPSAGSRFTAPCRPE
ncbi:hypothetical protein T492DRAFT_997145 [Pavlovales sp. CCMP2436]|nr:hypothetical protein T492DRAFT_997145 [Pavlovales sp. CCMP2436]